MKRERITAILVGSLFFLGTLAGIASAIISGPLLNVINVGNQELA